MFRAYNSTIITNGEHGSTTVDSSATWNRNGPITATANNSFRSIIASHTGNGAVASGISFKEDKLKGIYRVFLGYGRWYAMHLNIYNSCSVCSVVSH